ncbi:MAG: gamma-glutamyltransferase family protein [Lautropia sp.]
MRRLTSVTARRFMVATANPLASRAAQAVLAAGGSATDAVVAAQMMLALVEPQSSGLGGGAFLVTFDAASRRVEAWDGRETAPAAADEKLFLDAQGKPLPFTTAVVGGRSVGVPGAVRMLELAHHARGRLRWRELLSPAIDAARDGFEIGPRLATLIAGDTALKNDPVAAAYFFDADGRPLAAGHRLRNPTFADTLAQIAERGSAALHEGPIAEAIVAKVRTHPTNPGVMTAADLADYRALHRDPLCFDWQRWRLCGMPPPSSGTIALGQILGILEARGFAGLVLRNGSAAPQLDPEGVHRFSEAGRLAYADRARYVADSDFVPLPPGLLAPGYLQSRARQIGDRSMGVADAGAPRAFEYPERGTSHVSVVDADGNAASLTTTIEGQFGSKQMVAGFLLNNELTDFSFAATEPVGADRTPQPVANRVQPGKRPRSSMTPLLIFERVDGPAAPAESPQAAVAQAAGAAPRRLGPLVMVTGSPGGSAIINYVAKTVIATLHDGIDPQQAIDLPNIGSRNGPTELERGRVAPELIQALRERGHETREIAQTSGIQTILRRCEDRMPDRCQWIGAADSRREGIALGE